MENLFLYSQRFQNKISWDQFLIWVLSSQKRMLSIGLSIVLPGEKLTHFHVSEVNFPSKHHCLLPAVPALSLPRFCANCSTAVPSLKSRTRGPDALSVSRAQHVPRFRVKDVENKSGRFIYTSWFVFISKSQRKVFQSVSRIPRLKKLKACLRASEYFSCVLLVFSQLLLKLEETGLETEGILRVPGSASRVKVRPRAIFLSPGPQTLCKITPTNPRCT